MMGGKKDQLRGKELVEGFQGAREDPV